MKRLLLFSLILGLITFLLWLIQGRSFLIHPYIWYIFAANATIGILVALIDKVAFHHKDHSAYIFLGAMILRLLLSIIIIGGFLYAGVEARLVFVGNFMAFYLCYLVFEITGIISKLRPNLNRGM